MNILNLPYYTVLSVEETDAEDRVPVRVQCETIAELRELAAPGVARSVALPNTRRAAVRGYRSSQTGARTPRPRGERAFYGRSRLSVEVCAMGESRERVRPLYAALLTDGSIEVELAIPDQEDPVTTTIDPTKASRWLVTPDSVRVIDLDDVGDAENAQLRRMVDAYIVLVERHIAEVKARQPQRGRQRGR